MTALYIIVGILLFIFLLLMIPVSFRFRYDGEPELILQYLFVRIKLVPPKEKSEKQKNESKKSEKPKEKKPEKKEIFILYSLFFHCKIYVNFLSQDIFRIFLNCHFLFQAYA